MPLHIQSALQGQGYSICSFFLNLSYRFGREAGCAFVLAMISLLTAFAATGFLREIIQLSGTKVQFSWLQTFLIATPFCFVGSIYIPRYFPIFYLDPHYTMAGDRFSMMTQPWHNSTYLFMRLFGLVVLKYFFRIESDYLDKGVKLKDWICFFVALTLVNASKPNFFIVFAPMMLIWLVVTFIQRRGKGFMRMVQFGAAVLLSMPVLFFQMNTLFPGGEESDSGVTITLRILKKLIAEGTLAPMVLASMAFMIVVSFLCFRAKGWTKALLFSWGMYMLSLGIAIAFQETGARANHGNFGWGIFFFGMVLAMICFDRLVAIKEKIGKSGYYLAYLLLYFMVTTGFVYYISILEGKSYLM